MSFFFKNHGPFDINYIIKNTKFSEKKKLKKDLVKGICSLSENKNKHISFYNNIKYLNILKETNINYCFIKKKI